MTVRDWLDSRSPAAPEPLRDRLSALLGSDAEAPAAEATRILVAASQRTLGQLVSARRFTREGALDLLAADAFMTYAFEHAAASGMAAEALGQQASRAAAAVGQILRTHD